MACLTIACEVEYREVGRNDAIRHYLNARDYEQAILLLNERLAADPSDDKARILLASAYSGSVGINTIDCFEVLRPKLFERPLALPAKKPRPTVAPDVPDDHPSSSSREAAKRQRILAAEREFLKFATQTADAMEVAFLFPHIPSANRTRIVLSLSILSEIPNNSDQYLTAQLYQGILGFVQFMNYLRDGIPDGSPVLRPHPAWYLNLYCNFDLGLLLPNLAQATDYLAGALASLMRAGVTKKTPFASNLLAAQERLAALNLLYLQEPDAFELVDWALRSTKGALCE